jgi:hypothetical protein
MSFIAGISEFFDLVCDVFSNIGILVIRFGERDISCLASGMFVLLTMTDRFSGLRESCEISSASFPFPFTGL